MRPHTEAEALAVVECLEDWQAVFVRVLGRRLAFAADEYYLQAGRPFPEAETYDDFPMHEDGIGMARTFEREFLGRMTEPTGPKAGFFAWVDGAPADGYRAPRAVAGSAPHPDDAPITILTGELGAQVLEPLRAELPGTVEVLPVPNEFFGGNIGVTGLLTGADLARVLADRPAGRRYLLPDVALSRGRFLDGTTIEDLPHPVEVVATDGASLVAALRS
jgi:NifB/MoaA-like Fe-S oxidoreductase